MGHSVIHIFRKAFEFRENMTVNPNAGGGKGKKGKGKEFLGVIQFKMSTMKEVLKRRNQIGTRIKMRLLKNMRREESRIEEEFQMRKLDEELKKMKKEIKELIRRAKRDVGEIPAVRVRLQVTFPKKAESVLLRDKDVKAERMKTLGIPGAQTLELAVKHIQSQINDMKMLQTSMLDEANKLLNSLGNMEM